MASGDNETFAGKRCVFNVYGNNEVKIGVFDTESPAEEDDDETENNKSVTENEELEDIRTSHQMISTKQLQDLARNIGAPYRVLMRHLDIPQHKVDQACEENGHNDLDEILYQLLRGWRQESEEPTVSKMLEAIESSGLHRLWVHLKPEEE